MAEELPGPAAYQPVPDAGELPGPLALGAAAAGISPFSSAKPRQEPVLSFEVTLERGETEDMYGIAQRLTKDGSETLLVVALKPGGLADRWNTARPSAPNQIRPNDRIALVNGITKDVARMRMALREPKLVLAVLRYPEIFEVRLDRDAGGLYGMRTVKAVEEDGRKMLIVHAISEEGAAHAWNERMFFERKFELIVAEAAELLQVNAKTSPQEMQEELQSSPSVVVRFRRPPANVEVMG